MRTNRDSVAPGDGVGAGVAPRQLRFHAVFVIVVGVRRPAETSQDRNKRTERRDGHASDASSIRERLLHQQQVGARATLAAREHETKKQLRAQRAPDGQEGDGVGHDLSRVEVEVELGEGVNRAVGPPQDDLVQEAIAAAGNADLEPNRSPTETEELQHEQPNCA